MIRRNLFSSRRGIHLATAALLVIPTLAIPQATTAQIAVAPEIDTLTPKRQRVHDFITLTGKGFGAYQAGVSRVVFNTEPIADVDDLFDAGAPYVWRNDFIQVRVPVGGIINGAATPIPKGKLYAFVVIGKRISNPFEFQVITAADDGPLTFRQLTKIENDQDVSSFLGNPKLNLARSKDADIGDINNDGWPDIVDNNSNNISNGTHGVVRLNRRNRTFLGIALEPVDENDTQGPFATVIPDGGTFFGNAVTYDSDLVDLTNDGRPELVQALNTAQIRVLENRLGQPQISRFNVFRENTASWFSGSFTGAPDDIAHVDIDGNGFVDIGVGLRFSPNASLLLNRGGETFGAEILLTTSSGTGSIHDVFFLDAEGDGDQDAVIVDESGNSQVFLNDGNASPAFQAGATFSGFVQRAGAAGDLDGDGLADFAIVGRTSAFVAQADVYLNDPANPGTFTRQQLPLPGNGSFYDVEFGDVDVDGDVDIIAASIITDAELAIVVWLNVGGTFVNATAGGASSLLPGIGPYQRLSADLIDFDRDGDLDLYITGADGQSVGFGFGAVPNQFYENRRISLAISPEQ